MADGKRYTGIIKTYYRLRGYGSLEAKKYPNIRIRSEDVVTDDEWPYMKCGTKVEYNIAFEHHIPFARKITLPGGDKIPVFTKAYEGRTLNEKDVYKGSVKFYDWKKGWGVLSPDTEITWEGVTNTPEQGIYFRKDAVLCDRGKDKRLRVVEGRRVSFKVYKGKQGLGAFDVQNEDGTSIKCIPTKEWLEITRCWKRELAFGKGKKRKRKENSSEKKNAKKAKKDDVSGKKEEKVDGNKKNVDGDGKTTKMTVKNDQADGVTADNGKKMKKKKRSKLNLGRKVVNDGKIYTGFLRKWKPENEKGIIKLTEDVSYEDCVVKQKIGVFKRDIVSASDLMELVPKTKVQFKVYMTPRGLSACEVKNVDGTPIGYKKESKNSEGQMVTEENQS